MLDFTKLWNKIYILGPNPVEMSRSDMLFLRIAAGLILGAIVFRFFATRKEPNHPGRMLYRRLSNLFLTIGLSGLLWAGARYENAPWIAKHLVILLIYVLGLVWLGFIGRYYLQKHGKLKQSWQEEKLRRKYLP